MSLEPEKMVEELRVAAQAEVPEDLTDPEAKWMYLLGRVAGAVQIANSTGRSA